jgi:hypothetical protein
MEGFDLRDYQDNEEIKDIFGKLISGRSGYKTVIEKRKDIKKCGNCEKVLEGDEKFCPECGDKQN